MPTTVPRRLALASLLLLGAACSSDKPTGPSVSALVGTWDATQITLTSQANPSNTIDGIASGLGIELTFDASGGYTAVTTTQGISPDTATGTATVNGNAITLTDATNEVTSGTFSVNGNTLTVHFTQGLTFDFGSGDEAATLDATLIKQ